MDKKHFANKLGKNAPENSNLSKRWTFVITNSKPYKNSPCILSLNMHGLFVTLDFVCDERVFIFWIDINAL